MQVERQSGTDGKKMEGSVLMASLSRHGDTSIKTPLSVINYLETVLMLDQNSFIRNKLLGNGHYVFIMFVGIVIIFYFRLFLNKDN